MFRMNGIILSILVMTTLSVAQISPGDLTESHKDLEGIGNCTNCHTIGKALSNDNCLQCHTEIKSRIANKKGYHATIASKECVECHKEHHGRKFKIIRFDKEKFNHAQTGFNLAGKHAALTCEQCHAKEKIKAIDILSFPDGRKSRTFLGLSSSCLSCHRDEHRGQFKAECIQCHTMNGWKPASKFSHDNAQFKLQGAHTSVDCAKCHVRNLENGTVTQFVHMEFSSCRSCHAGPHKGKFKKECSQCHSVESWHRVQSSEFDHNATQFPLRGKHGVLRCEQCHPKNAKEKNPNGEFGFHLTRFSTCKDCHADAHARQFNSRNDKGECSACHTEKGFAGSTYSVTDHAASRFALTGAHASVSCLKCHLDGKVNAKSTNQFLWNEKLTCTTCHNDVHKGQFNKRMTNGCETCHTTDAWEDVRFSHDSTRFPLKGKHAAVPCSQCHRTRDGVSQYVDVPKECDQCHEDRHGGQFALNRTTQCERCHVERSWKILLFDHNAHSRFNLTGKHETVACEKCHKETVIGNNRVTKYKPLEAACIDCHPAQ